MLLTDIGHANGVTFHAGIHFIGMLTGLIRISTVIANSTGFGGENQLILIVAENIVLNLLDDLGMFTPCRQHFVHIKNVTDFRYGAKNKGMLVACAPLLTVFDGSNCWGTGPGFPILGAFLFADGMDCLIKINL